MAKPMHKVPFTRWRVEFEAEKPVKRFLRKRNVLTMLAVAALMLSIAALLVVIGIGETQIIASENAGNHTANLFANGWFDVGLLLAGLGIFIGTVAISANSSQAAALNEFPDLVIRIVAGAGPTEVIEPGGAPYGIKVYLYHARLRIFNRERDRTAVLSPELLWPVRPTVETVAWAISTLGFSPARWVPTTFEGLQSISALALPLHVSPRSAVEGDVFFELSLEQIERLESARPPSVILRDEISGMWFWVLTSTGDDQGPFVT
jgi:hypothetical protein